MHVSTPFLCTCVRVADPSAASPLTEPPQTPPPDVELAPKVPEETAKKQRKEKKQIIDPVTELADGPGARVGRGRNAGLGAPVDVWAVGMERGESAGHVRLGGTDKAGDR